MLVLEEEGKPESPEKNPRSKGENQQQTQSTYYAGSGNRTRDTLVEGERSHHCATPAPLRVFLVKMGVAAVSFPFIEQASEQRSMPGVSKKT